MILDCIRHGVTPSNLAGRFNGSSLEGITEAQRGALERVRFDPSGYDAIFASDLPRCVQTAQALRLPGVQVDPRLRERHLGVFEGLTPAECAVQHAADFAAFQTFDADTAMPGGESRGEHLARLTAWIATLGGVSRVLAVTHGGTIDFLYRLGTGRPIHGGEVIFAGANACLTRFKVSWPQARLVFYEQPLG